jgi:hypothetical protein
MNLEKALHMNTEEHQQNAGKNLQKIVAFFPFTIAVRG